MDYAHLGDSGLRASRLCLGTVNFGWRTEVDQALAILDRAQELGVNVIDTADSYGGSWGKGGVESLLGRWFAGDPARRDRALLATKVFNSFTDWPNDGGLSALHIRRACDASLRRLGTDYIDLYQLHYPDPGTPWDETWEALDRLRTQGKILYIGAANLGRADLVALSGPAKRHQSTGIVSLQSEYNVLARAVESDSLPTCRDLSIGFLAWSPLAGGVLAGPVGDRRSLPGAQTVRDRYAAALRVWDSCCADAGRPPADLALAWVLGRPGVSAAIVGPRTVEQLERAAAAAREPLDPQLQCRIDVLLESTDDRAERSTSA
jgi:aryl-alcohol dehydrogenase-like predicted oxidoreductase